MKLPRVCSRFARAALCLAVGSSTSGAPAEANTPPADDVIAQIRDEGLNRSQVMETLDSLCNGIGARLTGSPNAKKANEWTRDQFAKWGCDAKLEAWGPFGRSWVLKRYFLQVTSPQVIVLNGYPKAWSPGVEGPIEAPVVYMDVQKAADLENFRGKLKGKVVLIGAPRAVPAHFDPLATRQDDQRLARMESLPADVPLNGGRGPTTGPAGAAGAGARGAAGSQPAAGRGGGTASLLTQRAFALATAEEAALVIDASTNGDGGTIFVTSATVPTSGNRELVTTTTTTRPWAAQAPKLVPQVTLAVEDYNRLVRMIQQGQEVKVSFDLKVDFAAEAPTYNTIAEIPGTELRNEIVMAGAHLDSWQAGTGATDNGTGSAAVMEAARIIQALHLKPRRTIRFALWTGEEEGLLGSRAYVKAHFGSMQEPPGRAAADGTTEPATRPASVLVKGPEFEKLSVYFNIDTGTGKIRGVSAQSNPRAAAILRKFIAPFNDLGAATVTLGNMASTDHVSFDTVGLPAFNFVQDAIEYGTRTHHSNEDVYDRIQADDMKQASTVLAAFLWQAANLEEKFPRKAGP